MFSLFLCVCPQTRDIRWSMFWRGEGQVVHCPGRWSGQVVHGLWVRSRVRWSWPREVRSGSSWFLKGLGQVVHGLGEDKGVQMVQCLANRDAGDCGWYCLLILMGDCLVVDTFEINIYKYHWFCFTFENQYVHNRYNNFVTLFVTVGELSTYILLIQILLIFLTLPRQ